VPSDGRRQDLFAALNCLASLGNLVQERLHMTHRHAINCGKPAPLIGAVVIIISLGAVLMSSRANEPDEGDDKQSPGVAAASALLQSLPQAERTQAQLPFDSSERTQWN
jgi:hypothetical protein